MAVNFNSVTNANRVTITSPTVLDLFDLSTQTGWSGSFLTVIDEGIHRTYTMPATSNSGSSTVRGGPTAAGAMVTVADGAELIINPETSKLSGRSQCLIYVASGGKLTLGTVSETVRGYARQSSPLTAVLNEANPNLWYAGTGIYIDDGGELEVAGGVTVNMRNGVSFQAGSTVIINGEFIQITDDTITSGDVRSATLAGGRGFVSEIRTGITGTGSWHQVGGEFIQFVSAAPAIPVSFETSPAGYFIQNSALNTTASEFPIITDLEAANKGNGQEDNGANLNGINLQLQSNATNTADISGTNLSSYIGNSRYNKPSNATGAMVCRNSQSGSGTETRGSEGGGSNLASHVDNRNGGYIRFTKQIVFDVTRFSDGAAVADARFFIRDTDNSARTGTAKLDTADNRDFVYSNTIGSITTDNPLEITLGIVNVTTGGKVRGNPDDGIWSVDRRGKTNTVTLNANGDVISGDDFDVYVWHPEYGVAFETSRVLSGTGVETISFILFDDESYSNTTFSGTTIGNLDELYDAIKQSKTSEAQSVYETNVVATRSIELPAPDTLYATPAGLALDFGSYDFSAPGIGTSLFTASTAGIDTFASSVSVSSPTVGTAVFTPGGTAISTDETVQFIVSINGTDYSSGNIAATLIGSTTAAPADIVDSIFTGTPVGNVLSVSGSILTVLNTAMAGIATITWDRSLGLVTVTTVSDGDIPMVFSYSGWDDLLTATPVLVRTAGSTVTTGNIQLLEAGTKFDSLSTDGRIDCDNIDVSSLNVLSADMFTNIPRITSNTIVRGTPFGSRTLRYEGTSSTTIEPGRVRFVGNQIGFNIIDIDGVNQSAFFGDLEPGNTVVFDGVTYSVTGVGGTATVPVLTLGSVISNAFESGYGIFTFSGTGVTSAANALTVNGDYGATFESGQYQLSSGVNYGFIDGAFTNSNADLIGPASTPNAVVGILEGQSPMSVTGKASIPNVTFEIVPTLFNIVLPALAGNYIIRNNGAAATLHTGSATGSTSTSGTTTLEIDILSYTNPNDITIYWTGEDYFDIVQTFTGSDTTIIAVADNNRAEGSVEGSITLTQFASGIATFTGLTNTSLFSAAQTNLWWNHCKSYGVYTQATVAYREANAANTTPLIQLTSTSSTSVNGDHIRYHLPAGSAQQIMTNVLNTGATDITTTIPLNASQISFQMAGAYTSAQAQFDFSTAGLATGAEVTTIVDTQLKAGTLTNVGR